MDRACLIKSTVFYSLFLSFQNPYNITVLDDDDLHNFWGAPSDFQSAAHCMLAQQIQNNPSDAIVPYNCYCVTAGGSTCNTLTLSQYAKNDIRHQCGNILTTYTHFLITSTILCGLLVFIVMVYTLSFNHPRICEPLYRTTFFSSFPRSRLTVILAIL